MSSIAERASLVLGRDLVLGTLLERLARVHGRRRLVEEAGPASPGGLGGPGLRLTYESGAERVARLAGGILAATRPGDRTVIAVPNGYDLALCCLAAARAGTIAVPLNPQMREAEVAEVVRDSEAALVVRRAEDILADRPRAAVASDPSEVAGLFYTSGTTGKPKGVRLSHQALLGLLSPLAGWPARLRRDEAVIALPVAHVMGFIALLSLALAGVPVYSLPRFRAEQVLDAIEIRRATVFVGVPAMYRLMLEAGAGERDLRSVRVWASGADTMPAELARSFCRMGASATLPVVGLSVGRAAFFEGYGMVEMGGAVAAKVLAPLGRLPVDGSVGLPVPPNRLRVLDGAGQPAAAGQVGELWVKGPGALSGYHGDADATAAVLAGGGWVRTGDLARRGRLGVVVFAGRAKDVIKHGGYSVHALEVERALEEHPAVAEAAVLGLADERKGQVPVAAVRLVPGGDATEAVLVSWARDRLASYKAPRQVRILEELPRTGTDKVRKADLVPLFTGEPAG